VKRVGSVLCLALGTPSLLLAHQDGTLHPDNLRSAWEFDPGVVIPILVSCVLYWRGARLAAGTSRHHQTWFWLGITALVLALVSPLHPLGEQLFSAHMAQHEILMLVAAPLLVMAHPAVPMLFGIPLHWRRSIGAFTRTPVVRGVWRTLTHPVYAWILHAAAIWIWHAPALFQATLESDLAHTLQHCSFFFSALLFWWSLFFREDYGAAVLSLFTTSLHTGILGAILTLSPSVFYPAYSRTAPTWGLSPLEDQQLGGLIMWLPAGIVYIAAALYFVAAWLRESDLTAARRSQHAS